MLYVRKLFNVFLMILFSLLNTVCSLIFSEVCFVEYEPNNAVHVYGLTFPGSVNGFSSLSDLDR